MNIQTLANSNERPFASIITPFALYHAAIVQRAVDSAMDQSLPVEIITIEDTEHTGAGLARNAGATQATAPFIVFLDADDHLHPAFVERTLLRWQPGHYVYCDWVQGARMYTLPH